MGVSSDFFLQSINFHDEPSSIHFFGRAGALLHVMGVNVY
jgi:hypothetical protein